MAPAAFQAPVQDAAKEVLVSKLREPSTSSSSSSSVPGLGSLTIASSAAASASTESQASSSDIETVTMSDHTFEAPRKRIVSPASLQRFESSSAFAEILAFIRVCNTSVVGKMLTDDIAVSPACRAILDVLEEVKAIRQATPPDASIGSSRFGNPAFRTFYAKIRDANDRLHRSIPNLDGNSDTAAAARSELAVYFQESWGNEKRIDYGSGMELNMACSSFLVLLPVSACASCASYAYQKTARRSCCAYSGATSR
ncbi:hypothetical protein L1887_55733 [Cichorium endivia]|nr:hypothetical protein L1887_55733 [Cichorium endivia]